MLSQVSGGHGGGVTPVPIPNTAVKPARADGTWGEAPWESRSLPGFLNDEIPSELWLEGILSLPRPFRRIHLGLDHRSNTAPLSPIATPTTTAPATSGGTGRRSPRCPCCQSAPDPG